MYDDLSTEDSDSDSEEEDPAESSSQEDNTSLSTLADVSTLPDSAGESIVTVQKAETSSGNEGRHCETSSGREGDLETPSGIIENKVEGPMMQVKQTDNTKTNELKSVR